MKKIITAILMLSMILALASCGANGTHNSLCKQLRETSMPEAEFNEDEIDEFEDRFDTIGLDEGFKRVTQFKSVDEYAYVITFEDKNDAENFSELMALSYDVQRFGKVVVYGESDTIPSLKK